ncbi:serine/threonine protein kinase [Planctomicrobium sp. SH661]|uniref:serine/threonine protein kinase n=1 Tax=Planctomicrobium sp. SH661 TaxID=3448124 RepID=UPI003F5C95DC
MKFTFPPESRPLEGFTLKRAIYRGGFGEVYYGISDSGREVALKLLQHNTDVELRGVQQCLNLSHPNLVTIFDVRKDHDGDHWIIMEYVSGETLEAAIHRHPNGMPVETVRKWLPGITAGVGFLHSCGLVHRDLKPANIFIENDVVKVGDVGLTKFISVSKQSAHTQSVGTVYYMAPEVAKGRYGKAVDVYALGVILYEMLTGNLPFDGESTGEILMKHLTEQPDLSKLPPRLQKVVARALQKDPEDRYSSVHELTEAFDAAVLGTDVAARGQPVVQQQRSTSSRNQSNRRWFEIAKPGSRRRFSGILLLLILLSSLVAARLDVSVPGLLGLEMGLLAVLFAVFRWFPRNSEKHLSAEELISRSRPVKQKEIARRSSPISAALKSNILAVPTILLLSGLLAALRPSLFSLNHSDKIDPGLLGFFIFVSVLASWGVGFLSALSADARHNGRSSRWSNAVIGSIVGILAWKLDQFLLVDLPARGEFSTRALFHQLGEHPLVSPSTGPTLAGYFAFFTTLFALRNWSYLTSPRREKRFSIGAVFMTLFIAILTTKAFEFPLPWGLAWAAVVACSVQLSSPWNDSSRARFIDHR